MLVLGSEPWTEIIRGHIEKRLGLHATNIYGLSEIIGPGVSMEDWEEKGRILYLGRSFLSGNTGSCNEAACSVW